MGDDMHGLEVPEPFESRSDLPCRRLKTIEHDRPDFGSQVAKNGLDVGDRRIHKEDFRGAGGGHDWLLLASN